MVRQRDSKVNKRVALMHTAAIKKLRRMKKRIRVVPGGTSAGKTYGILPILIDRAAKTDFLEISVVSETMPHLKKGAVKDFKKIMQQTGRWKRSHWHETDKKYTFDNGSYIEFFSADDDSRVRGPRRNILYVNEANNIKWETYYQMSIRTDMEIYIDYNPTHEFWVHENLLQRKNVEVLRLTYKDNEALSKTIVKELESNRELAKTSKFWANWCRVYLDGLVGQLEGAVYKDWIQKDTIPAEARLLGYGLDFGYTNDPTALVSVYKYNNEFYFRQEIYQTGLKTRELAALMKARGIRRSKVIYCDSAEPKTRDELREYGFQVVSATKGADSIRSGIDILQSIKMNITKSSTDIIRELRHYVWDEDRQGKKLNKPVDAFNHALDAMRYFAMMSIAKRRKPKGGGVTYN